MTRAEYAADYQRKRNKLLRSDGRCVVCKEKTAGWYCGSCASGRRHYQIDRHVRRRTNGLCIQCGKKRGSSTSYCEYHYVKNKTRTRNQARVMHDIVYAHYGNKCACCGEMERKFLSIDHKNNDGNMRRNIDGFGATLYRKVINLKFPDIFQLLCMNCNMGKARNGGICPHKGGTPQ